MKELDKWSKISWKFVARLQKQTAYISLICYLFVWDKVQ